MVLIRNYNDNRYEEYLLEIDVEYPENLHNLHNDLLFLPVTRKTEKVEKFVANFSDKELYVIYIRNLKQVLNHG